MTIEDALKENNLITDLRLSASRISDFDRNGPRTLLHKSKISGEFLDFGSLVDDMLQPGFNIKYKYYIFDGEKPTAMLGILCEELINILNNPNKGVIITTDNELILATIKRLGLWKSTKDVDVLLNKFTVSAKQYVEAMVASVGKTLITNILFHEAEEMVAILKTHEYSRDIYKKDLLHQVEINFEYANFKFLSYLDYVGVNHENKTIKGIDLKTGSNSVSEFTSNFMKYRYYIQAMVYQIALNNYKYDNGLDDYEILGFEFLYCSRSEKIPTILLFTEKWENCALNGFTTTSGYKYRGLDELLESITWHWKNEVFNMTREQYENKGHIKINDEFINEL
jgi:hypothetical protein